MRRRRVRTLGVVLLVGALVGVVALAASVFGASGDPSCEQPVVAIVPAIDVDAMAAARRLSEAVRLRTVSDDDPTLISPEPFLRLHDLLQRSYPSAHRVLEREVINRYSLLYTWKGTDAGLKPILLLAHLDVVPIEEGTERAWTHPPFSGEVAGGHIWGRGAIDDKSAVIGILEAVDILARQRLAPKRTVYIAFGHDEESRGDRGAAAIAATLRARGVAFEYVLDEGLVITDGFIPGIAHPIAMVGTAEKGWLTLELAARDAGGHASMPPPTTSIGMLASAIHRLETAPLATALRPPVSDLFACLAPTMPFLRRVAFSNISVFGPLIRRELARTPATNALVRTTTAATMIKAGTKDNVLPAAATAVVNFRLLPGDDTSTVTEYAQRVIADRRIQVTPLKREEPTPVSANDSASFRAIATTIRQIFPRAIVTPALVVVRTDSAHFLDMTSAVYRFRPIRLTPADLSRIHGTNERLAVDDLAALIRFYVQLLRNSALDTPGGPRSGDAPRASDPT